jgi:hypothetical protein
MDILDFLKKDRKPEPEPKPDNLMSYPLPTDADGEYAQPVIRTVISLSGLSDLDKAKAAEANGSVIRSGTEFVQRQRYY